MRKEQTKLESLIEQIIGRFFGFMVATATAQLFVYDMFNIKVSATKNISMMLYFTFQNIIVSYFIRRFFESRGKSS